MKTLWQIYAIARNEFRFGLRRGGPVVTTLLIGLVVGAGILWNGLSDLATARDDFRQVLQNTVLIERLREKGLTVDYFRQNAVGSKAEDIVASVQMAWPILLLTSFLLLPAATVTSLPSDSIFGVAELLRSIPLSGGSYLAGKVLGIGIMIMLVGLIPLGIFFGVLEGGFQYAFKVGVPADVVGFFIKFALLDGLPILGWGAAIGILVGSLFRSRRAAVFPALLAGIISILFWEVAFNAPAMPFAQLDVIAYYLLQNYHSTALDAIDKLQGFEPYVLLGKGVPVIEIGRVVLMYLIIFVAFLIVAILVRLWLKWKENF